MATRHTPLRVAFAKPVPATVRGRSLWFLSLIIGLKGFGYLTGRAAASTDESISLGGFHYPLAMCGAVFLTVCLFSGFCSYCHFGRDRYGYIALYALTLGWAGVYAMPPVVEAVCEGLRLFGVDASKVAAAPAASVQGALSWLLIFAFVRFLARNITLRDLMDGLDQGPRR